MEQRMPMEYSRVFHWGVGEHGILTRLGSKNSRYSASNLVFAQELILAWGSTADSILIT